jgi:hypothetical protein
MNIQIGSRYQRTSPPYHLWRVEHVSTDPKGLPHARLTRVDFPQESRTISADTIENDRFYRRIDRQAVQPVDKQPPGRMLTMLSGLFA